MLEKRSNMKKVLGFFKNFLAVILVITSFLGMQGYVLLNSIAKLTSKENITNMVEAMDFTTIIGEEDKKDIYKELEQAGIPKEYVEPVLENEKLKETVGNFVSDVLVSAINEEKLPTIDEKKLTTDLKDVFDTVVKEVGTDKITEKEIKEVHKAIEEYTPELVKYVNNSKDELETYIKENVSIENEIEKDPTMKQFYHVYQKRSYFMYGALISFALLIALKWKDLKFVKWCAASIILSAIAFLAIGSLLPILANAIATGELAELKSMIDVSINMMKNSYLWKGIMSFIIGVLMIISTFALKKLKKEPTEVV